MDSKNFGLLGLTVSILLAGCGAESGNETASTADDGFSNPTAYSGSSELKTITSDEGQSLGDATTSVVTSMLVVPSDKLPGGVTLTGHDVIVMDTASKKQAKERIKELKNSSMPSLPTGVVVSCNVSGSKDDSTNDFSQSGKAIFNECVEADDYSTWYTDGSADLTITGQVVWEEIAQQAASLGFVTDSAGIEWKDWGSNQNWATDVPWGHGLDTGRLLLKQEPISANQFKESWNVDVTLYDYLSDTTEVWKSYEECIVTDQGVFDEWGYPIFDYACSEIIATDEGVVKAEAVDGKDAVVYDETNEVFTVNFNLSHPVEGVYNVAGTDLKACTSATGEGIGEGILEIYELQLNVEGKLERKNPTVPTLKFDFTAQADCNTATMYFNNLEFGVVTF